LTAAARPTLLRVVIYFLPPPLPGGHESHPTTGRPARSFASKVLPKGDEEMKRVVLAFLVAATTVSVFSPTAFAMSEFKKEFKKKYMDTHKDEAFQKLAKKASCSVCHVKTEKKTVVNEYGTHLAKLIEGNAKKRKDDAEEKDGVEGKKAEQEKLIKELNKAFEEVAKMKSEEGDTFGDRIKNGLLPSTTDKPKTDDKEEEKKAEDK